MSTPFLFRFRQPLATVPSLLVLLTLLVAGVQKATELKRREDPQPVQIALMELPAPAPPQPVPSPKPETPPAPRPPVRAQEPARALRQPTPPTPSSTPVSAAATPAPAAPPAATPTASAAPATAPAVAAAPATPAAPVQPAAPAPNTASLEAQYVAQLRAHLNSIKRYPTGREASQLRPQGRVRVWFVVRRDGSVVEQGIESSSNSMLLDDAARKTISRASFAGFPEGAFGAEATHRFTADLEFVPS